MGTGVRWRDCVPRPCGCMCGSNRSGFAVRVKLHFLAISILVYENSIVVEMQLAPILESNLSNATTTCSVRHDSVSIVLRMFHLLRNKLLGIGGLNLGAGASRWYDYLVAIRLGMSLSSIHIHLAFYRGRMRQMSETYCPGICVYVCGL